MTVAHHSDAVARAVQSNSAEGLTSSWRRSMMTYALDPGDAQRMGRLTDAELRERQAASDRMRHVANPLLDKLYAVVGASGCGVFMTDAAGVILDQRCSPADGPLFQGWNLWSGAEWSEACEGTNGIGTCLAEGRRVVIHRNEHFATRNTAMSCIDAPIFGPEGQIIGALDVSSARADQSEALNRLMSESVAQTARQIEADLFRRAHPGCRIVVADAEGTALLAVDSDDVVQGANRTARRQHGHAIGGGLTPCPAVDLLQEAPDRRGFDRGEYAAIKRALLRQGGNASAAARDLGIGRATLYRRAKRLGVTEL